MRKRKIYIVLLIVIMVAMSSEYVCYSDSVEGAVRTSSASAVFTPVINGNGTVIAKNNSANNKTNTVQIPIAVTINGSSLTFDVQPVNSNGRVLVPLRAIFEALGAQIEWDDNLKMATARKGGTEIILLPGAIKAVRNGWPVDLDEPATIIDGRILVPVRFVSEALGATVNWDAATQTVSIIQQ